MITSFFTTTPLAINYCSIICHSNSSIVVEAHVSTSTKRQLATTFTDFHP
jgi:hypothetical protein